MTLGDIVGRGCRIVRQRWPELFSILFIPSFLIQLSVVGLRMDILYFFQRHQGNSIPLAIIGCALCLILNLAAQWVRTLRTVAVVRMVNNAPLSYKDACQYTKERRGRIAAVYLLTIILPFVVFMVWCGFEVALCISWPVGMFLSAVARVILFLNSIALVIGIFFSMLWCFLTLCVLACEDVNYGEVLSRGVVLSWHGLWRGTLFMFLLFLTILLLQTASRLPPAILGFIDYSARGIPAVHDLKDLHALASTDSLQPSFVVEIICLFWNSLVSVLVIAISCITYGIFYDDLRKRTEASDIVRKIDQLAKSQA